MSVKKIYATPHEPHTWFEAREKRSCETVDAKYHGLVDLKTFECHDINRSSFIQRVCYDKAQRSSAGAIG